MKTIRRLPIVFLLALLSVSLALPGCGTSLSTVIADVDEGTLAVHTIQAFVDGLNLAPATKTTIDAAIVKVESAAVTVLDVARGVSDLYGGNEAAAAQAFVASYTDLLALVKSFGVSVGTKGARMAAKPGGGLTVPAPEDLLVSLRKKS